MLPSISKNALLTADIRPILFDHATVPKSFGKHGISSQSDLTEPQHGNLRRVGHQYAGALLRQVRVP